MTTATKTRKARKTTSFDNQTRFNWGFHAAALAVREAANLTQATIAEALGVAVQRVSEYERGKREPGSVTLWKIAKACGVTARAARPH